VAVKCELSRDPMVRTMRRVVGCENHTRGFLHLWPFFAYSLLTRMFGRKMCQ
jgi:hypothetical protein